MKPKNQFKNKRGLWISICVIIIALAALKLVFATNDSILIKPDRIIIEGKYGEEIKLNEIAKIQLTDTLPKIESRSNGYASGEVRKGYFKTGFKKRVKLILNNNSKPYLYIETSKGNKIYFSESNEQNIVLHDEIKIAIKKHNPNHIVF